MTYAITLIKGNPKEREETHKLICGLSKSDSFRKKTGVEIKYVFVSFGWPDFVVLLEGNNVELLKSAIVMLRDEAGKKGDDIETSTIICTTQDEINKKSEKWAKELGS